MQTSTAVFSASLRGPKVAQALPSRQLSATKPIGRASLSGGRRVLRVNASDKDERNATIDTTVVEEAFSAGGKNINEAISQLPAEQQKALSQMYLFLVQNPSYGHNIRLQNWRDVQRAIAEEYQVLVWRPAELLNGRLAMIGFFLGSVTQMRTGQTVWAQLNAFPAAYLVAYGMVVLGSILNEQFGQPKEGVSIGPIKFSRVAELVNARAAMVGYAILMYIGYNTELQRAAYLFLQRVQQGQLPGINA